MPVIPNLAVITQTLNHKRLDKLMNVLYCVNMTDFIPAVAATHLSLNE